MIWLLWDLFQKTKIAVSYQLLKQRPLYFMGCYDNCLGTLLLCMVGNCHINSITALRRHFAIIMGTSVLLMMLSCSTYSSYHHHTHNCERASSIYYLCRWPAGNVIPQGKTMQFEILWGCRGQTQGVTEKCLNFRVHEQINAIISQI